MKILKKALVTVLIIAMAVSVLSVSAFASNYTKSADDLKSLGLFAGTGSGYDLDRTPTRIEAGVMLIRLLGKEDAALGGNFTHPFKDVPKWADKYVGYLYGTGLTKGISDTQFGSESPCDTSMYVTFVLRALGYDDSKGDFVYSQALTFGMIIGVLDFNLSESTFLRDEMVAISLLALSTQPKDMSAPTLLDKLVNEGAVSAAAAKPILERFTAYDECFDAVYNYNITEKRDADAAYSYNISAFGQTVPLKITESLKMIWESNELQMAYTTKMDMQGETFTGDCYYRGGYLYIKTGTDTVKMVMDPDEALEYMESSYASYVPLYGIESIAKTTSGGNTVYKIVLTDEYLKNFSDVLPQDVIDPLDPNSDVRNSTVHDGVIEITLNSAGALVSESFAMNMTIPVESNGVKTNATCAYLFTLTVRATGNSVVINFPSNLDTYLPVSSFSF